MAFIMRKKLLFAVLAMTWWGGAMAQNTNPLLSDFNTPFQIAPFDRITIDNYKEAFLKGMEEQKAEIRAIVKTRALPDFDNTIAALDQSGKLLDKALYTFSPLAG